MNSNIYKISSALLVLLSASGVTGCSDNGDMPGSHGDRSEMSLKIKGLVPISDDVAADALNVFQFDSDRLICHTKLTNYDAASIPLEKGATRSLYCVSGVELNAEEKTSLADFVKNTISLEDGANSAPLFFSGYAELDDKQSNCELTMQRGIARIDLDARDAEMEISEVIVEDAPGASYIFANESGVLDAPTVIYAHTFDSAPKNLEEGLFTMFESAKEVHVTVKGTARGTELEIPAVLPSVERNKIYTLRVYDRNVILSASFSVSDWEDGASISGGPDMAHAILIDENSSVIPAGVKVDYSRNIVDVPAEGVSNMILAFNTDLRVDLDTVHFIGDRVEVDSVKQKYVTISSGNPVNTPTGVVTKYVVNIAEQLKARPGYEMKLELRKPSVGISCDYVTIRVAESPYQIQTVKMAGSDWMAFNATTPDLGEQIFALPGKSVEETYQEAWVSTIGCFFQYGRQKAYSPWEKNDPNGNEDVERNIPWNSPSSMPLPEGYHVATAAEWVALLPVGTQIPSTYTAGNGESIKVEVVEYPGTITDSPVEAANAANLRKRCFRFESLDSGNVLLIPICGLKSNSWDQLPGYGKNKIHDFAGYWVAEDRYLWYFTITDNGGTLTSTQGQNRWNYNGFIPTRGVKNN
ncbi:MAG: hypothetical protein K2H76_01035 [Muribaculaceae bacterium]|nr:hypothetical protein [Muribaculaceae bacterium]